MKLLEIFSTKRSYRFIESFDEPLGHVDKPLIFFKEGVRDNLCNDPKSSAGKLSSIAGIEAASATLRREIEKKFLVKGGFKGEAFKATRITQGYLSSVPERTVRIRVKGDKGFITVKGIGNASGAARFEWEKEIPVDEVKALLDLAEPGVIDKTRYLVRNTDGKHTWEVDEFYGDNDGLVVAEVELADENEPFDKPAWLGEEVTGDPKYFNSMLMKNPYKNWK